MLKYLKHFLSFTPKEGGIPDPQSIRIKQISFITGGFCLFLLGGCYLFSSSSIQKEAAVKPVEKDTSTLGTPLKAVDEREIWVNRVEKRSREVLEEAEKVKQENQFLQKRMDVLEDLFKSQGAVKHSSSPDSDLSLEEERGTLPQPPQEEESPFSYQPSSVHPSSSYTPAVPGEQPVKKGAKILHLTRGSSLSSTALHTKETYLPAGSYSKAVLASGVAASTATNAQGNPQPIMLRLVDEGNLPRGFRSHVKDAVLLGACYGDISSERAFCRLETMSWVEENGVVVEKKVEGWVMGEDGRSGLRGEVVDRSGEVARESLVAGILSGMGSFFQMEATRGAHPVSPFGQTNALGNKEAFSGAAAGGAGSALSKLAEFSIRRAEQMQPVILIASGRVVDVVFKTGVDLSPDSPELKVVGASSDSLPGPEEN